MTFRHTSRRSWLLGLAAILGLATSATEAIAAQNCKGCFAMVRRDGTLLNSQGVTTSNRNAPGEYNVFFRYPITNCALTATITSFDNTVFTWAPLGIAYRSPTEASVIIIADGIGPVDDPFSLVATCP